VTVYLAVAFTVVAAVRLVCIAVALRRRRSST